MATKHKTGSKEAVWDGVALMTKGGLTKRDLMVNPKGKVVSKAKSLQAKMMFPDGPPGAPNRGGAIRRKRYYRKY